MNFVLVGGTGYVGGRLAAHLTSQGHRVCIATRQAPNGLPAQLPANEIVQWRMGGFETLARALRQCDVVFHLASPDRRTTGENPFGALGESSHLTWKIAEEISRAQNRPLVLYLSTFHVYGHTGADSVNEETVPRPSNVYGLNKLINEEIVRFFGRRDGLRALCIRMSNAFGAPACMHISQWSLIFNDLCRQAVLGSTLTLRSTVGRRNFIAMRDAVRGLEFLALNPDKWPPDGIIHLGSCLDLSLSEVAALVRRRAALVLGRRLAIASSQTQDESAAAISMHFSSERLAALGFEWDNPVGRELDDTLRLCASQRNGLSKLA